ncbi:19871_t:CDS:2, partial [Racocetra persica]
QLKYQLQNTILLLTTCIKLKSSYTQVVKQKASLARGVSNSTIINPYIYGLQDIAQIQKYNHIVSLSNQLDTITTINLYKPITKVCTLLEHKFPEPPQAWP